METCRIPYENARRTGVRNLLMKLTVRNNDDILSHFSKLMHDQSLQTLSPWFVEELTIWEQKDRPKTPELLTFELGIDVWLKVSIVIQ